MITVRRRDIFELNFKSQTKYPNPFIDIVIDCEFVSPSNKKYVMPCFYDGNGTWKVRFSPNEVGEWSYKTIMAPKDLSLDASGYFMVEEPEKHTKGFLKTCPGKYWGLMYESGEPAFIFGDTMYNLFGVAFCGLEYETVLKRRVEQGFNLIRSRLQVSPYHPPAGYNDWQTRSTWPWQGSPQKPQFDRFNLEYFQTVDKVMRFAMHLGIGFEMILEAWGFEYPFNQRDIFIPEYEELWIRYIIARYDAFSSVYIWTLMNEYEYYPDGDWRYNESADMWAIRTGKFVKSIAPHGHPVAVHNGPTQPPFAQRFKTAPGVIDLIMFQCWGTTGEKDAWLAAGIEDEITSSMKDWKGSFILAEYGYERNPKLDERFPYHNNISPEHTRRGAWRGTFSATGIIHGWEHTWGPWWIPNKDQEGMRYLLILKNFFTKIVEFHKFKPDSEVVDQSFNYEFGKKPLAMSTSNKDTVIVYFPAGGVANLVLPKGVAYEAKWFNPRTGKMKPVLTKNAVYTSKVETPDEKDWVLVLERKE
ncbi:MAG: DUF4038 domain-containing protein [Candidatus Bathyarchaeia archaeon]